MSKYDFEKTILDPEMVGFEVASDQTVTEIDVMPNHYIWSHQNGKQTALKKINLYMKGGYVFAVCISILFIFQQTFPQSRAEDPQQASLPKEVGAKIADQSSQVEVMYQDLPTVALPLFEESSVDIALDTVDESIREEVIEVTTVQGMHVEDFEVVRLSDGIDKAEKGKKENPKVPLQKITKASKVVQKKNIPQKKIKGERLKVAKKHFLHGDIIAAKSMLVGKRNLNVAEKKLLSEIYTLSCRTWVVDEDVKKALVDCEKAYQISKHDKAKKFLDEAESKAKELYYQGYAIESIDPVKAKVKYQQAMNYAPSKSAWKKKSMRKIKKLK